MGEAAALDFIDRSFGRAAWIGRTDPALAPLFGWNELNRVLADHQLDASRLRLERDGAGVSGWRDRAGAPKPERFLAELRDGATLILNGVQETSAPLRTLNAAFAADFTCHCQTNLYAAFGATQGFDVHWDDHEVFVVQVAGRKLWRLYGITREAPVVRADPKDHVAPPEPMSERTLEAGDLLYLPRGYWHAAVGIGEPSLHLTIGLTRRTGSEFLHWLADHLLSEPELRRDLPFEAGDAAVAEQLSRLLSSLGDRDAAALARQYRRSIESTLSWRPELSLPGLGGPETAFAPDDTLRLAAGVARLEPGPTTDSLILSWRGARYTLAASLDAPLRALVAGESPPVRAFDQAGRPDQVAELLRDLIADGLLVHLPSTG